MNGPPRLSCLIYSHGWCVQLLETLPPDWLQGRTLLIEAAQDSHLVPVLQCHDARLPGLAPLLAPPAKRTSWLGLRRAPADAEETLNSAARHYPGLPAPLILAANPPLSIAALESAIALLPGIAHDFDHLILLVHVNDAPRLSSAYQYAERIAVLWDLADLPSAALPRMAETLAGNRCLTSECWAGLHLCQHPSRPVADLEARRADWRVLLAEFPGLGFQREAA